MAITAFRRAIGIVLVVESTDGGIHLIGSKDVGMATVEHQIDTHQFGQDTTIRGMPRFRIEAECASLMEAYRAAAVACPPLTQQGIYLPDLSFRALPGGFK